MHRNASLLQVRDGSFQSFDSFLTDSVFPARCGNPRFGLDPSDSMRHAFVVVGSIGLRLVALSSWMLIASQTDSR